MSKPKIERRREKIRIDGQLHLVKVRYANPANVHTFRCPFCRTANMRAFMDIIQHGWLDDRMRSYFRCQECGHITEYRYRVECYKCDEEV